MNIKFHRRTDGLFKARTGLLMAMVALSGLLFGCGKSASPDGKALAAIQCGRCHTVPSPAQLAPEEWPYLLAWMGNYLGYKEEIPIHPLLVIKPFVPPKPLVTREEFDAIRNYFLQQSAVEFKRLDPIPEPPVSPLFEPIPQPVTNPVISMVAIDPVDHALVIGSSLPAGLSILRDEFNLPVEVASEPISFERLGDVRRIALIGHLGHDARAGSVIDFNLRDGSRAPLVSRHPRIACHRTADIDGDGQPDLLVCGFGDYPTGRVGIWWGGKDKREEQVLLDEAGAVWADVADMDGDGRPDILVTVANNRPRVIAFINKGNRNFEPRTIIERPVGWGYNRCLIVDWDGDGKPDLVELTGNNLELRGHPVKPQHGVRVMRNEGNWRFKEILFEPLPGAIDVVASDFDGNGRVDLAVTAFYPDWRLPYPTTFLLLMQRPDGAVDRFTIDHRYWNRWMRIGVGDVDGDGRTDLILGAAEVPSGIPPEQTARAKQMLTGQASVLVLRNRGLPK